MSRSNPLHFTGRVTMKGKQFRSLSWLPKWEGILLTTWGPRKPRTRPGACAYANWLLRPRPSQWVDQQHRPLEPLEMQMLGPAPERHLHGCQIPGLPCGTPSPFQLLAKVRPP